MPSPRYHVVASATDPSAAQPDVTVVIPAYQPGPALSALVEDLYATFADAELTVEVVVVDDGSTPPLALDADRRTTLLRGDNQGKGAALRAGFAHARAPLVGILDADGAYPAAVLLGLYRAIEHRTAPMAIASRRPSRGFRGLASRAFAYWVRLVLGLRGDTQAGAKLFTSELLADVAPYLTATGFAIDVDILAVARARSWYAPARVAATPLSTGSTTLTPSRVATALIDVLRLRRIVSRVPPREHPRPADRR